MDDDKVLESAEASLLVLKQLNEKVKPEIDGLRLLINRESIKLRSSPPQTLSSRAIEKLIEELDELKTRVSSLEIKSNINIDEIEPLDKLITLYLKQVKKNDPRLFNSKSTIEEKVAHIERNNKEIFEELDSINIKFEFIAAIEFSRKKQTQVELIPIDKETLQNDRFSRHLQNLKHYRDSNLDYLRVNKPLLLQELENVIKYLDKGYMPGKPTNKIPKPAKLIELNENNSEIDYQDNFVLENELYEGDFKQFAQESEVMGYLDLQNQDIEDQLMGISKELLQGAERITFLQQSTTAQINRPDDSDDFHMKLLEMERERNEVIEMQRELKNEQANKARERKMNQSINDMQTVMQMQVRSFQQMMERPTPAPPIVVIPSQKQRSELPASLPQIESVVNSNPIVQKLTGKDSQKGQASKRKSVEKIEVRTFRKGDTKIKKRIIRKGRRTILKKDLIDSPSSKYRNRTLSRRSKKSNLEISGTLSKPIQVSKSKVDY